MSAWYVKAGLDRLPSSLDAGRPPDRRCHQEFTFMGELLTVALHDRLADDFTAEDRGEATERFIDRAIRVRRTAADRARSSSSR
jgi:hypothetical protein